MGDGKEVPKLDLSLEEEKKQVGTALDVDMKKGDNFFAISKKWWNQWAVYVGMDPDDARGQKSGPGGQPRPGLIDSSDLIEEGPHNEIKKELSEGQTHFWIPEAAWTILHQSYGGGPILRRKVIAVGLRQSLKIEVYPQFLTVLVVDEETQEPKEEKSICSWSLQDSLQDVLDKNAPKDKGVAREGRIWMKKAKETKKETTGDSAKKEPDDPSKKESTATPTSPVMEWQLLPKDQLAVKFDDFALPSRVEVLLDYKKSDGLWTKQAGKKNWRDFAVGDIIDGKDTQGKWYESTIRDVKPDRVFVHYNNWAARWDEWMPKTSDRLAPKNTHTTGPFQQKGESSGWGSLYSQNEKGKPKERGAVGLRNLGNTCFMNSTLQCLSNTPQLTEFFVEDKHIAQINRKNPLGWNGKVAEAYGALLKELWGGEYSTVAPRTFKDTIGQFQPRFSGYQQHDSSELLSFLLDGIHEDCNRVQTKPATEAVESKGRPDAEVAKESWRRHLMRNQSVVVDMLQGQLKSRVTCPDCKGDSVTFDPFMFLSVPLPSVDHLMQSITFVPAIDPETPGSGVPRSITLKLSKYATIKVLKEALAKETGVGVEELILAEVWKNKILQEYHPDSRINFGPTDDVWAWQVSARKQQKDRPFLSAVLSALTPSTTAEFQLINHYMTDSRHYRSFGYPTIMTLPINKLEKYPIQELRAAIRTAIAPYLQDGKWPDGQSDKGNYLLEVMDSRGNDLRGEIELKDSGEVPLTKMGGGRSFTIGLFWNEKTKALLKESFVVKSTTQSEKKEGVKLGDCIDSFVTEETLPQSEAWYCRTCKGHKMAKKKFDIWSAPDTLIIHLKRFSYDRQWRDKLDTYVEFPTDGLDLSKWVVNEEEKKDAIYDLYAVSNHFGGLGSGHYTAYARNLINEQWYNLDDSSVSPVDKDACKTRAAYVLFYSRRKKKNRVWTEKDLVVEKVEKVEKEKEKEKEK